jgi:shikimate dehydrogenase
VTTPAWFVFGLVGFPLSHSLSPRLHSAALNFCGLQGEYRLIPIDPSDPVEAKLKILLDELREGRLQGLNVTIPYKQAVLPLLDRLTPSAQGVRAVNTIYHRDGELVGRIRMQLVFG